MLWSPMRKMGRHGPIQEKIKWHMQAVHKIDNRFTALKLVNKSINLWVVDRYRSCNWYEHLLNKTIEQYQELFSTYRSNDNLIDYSLLWL